MSANSTPEILIVGGGVVGALRGGGAWPAAEETGEGRGPAPLAGEKEKIPCVRAGGTEASL